MINYFINSRGLTGFTGSKLLDSEVQVLFEAFRTGQVVFPPLDQLNGHIKTHLKDIIISSNSQDYLQILNEIVSS